MTLTPHETELEAEHHHLLRHSIEQGRKLEALEEAYSRLWEDHQACQAAPPAAAGQAWFGDAYAVLGVRPDAELEVIEAAYKALVREYHPDRYPGDWKMDVRMKAITAAYAEVRRRRGYR